MKTKVAALVLCGAFAIAAVILWPTPEADPAEEVVEDDTGMTRFKTEELMREIGYVQ
jgi:hypothetical protein